MAEPTLARIEAAIARIEAAAATSSAARDTLAERHASLRGSVADAINAIDRLIAEEAAQAGEAGEEAD